MYTLIELYHTISGGPVRCHRRRLPPMDDRTNSTYMQIGYICVSRPRNTFTQPRSPANQRPSKTIADIPPGQVRNTYVYVVCKARSRLHGCTRARHSLKRRLPLHYSASSACELLQFVCDWRRPVAIRFPLLLRSDV